MGQAAGVAAALAAKGNCLPEDLSPNQIKDALIRFNSTSA
jgi:hypothetical protein